MNILADKKQVVVFGVGRMGTAISYAMKKLGYYVIGVDTHESGATNFRKHIKGEEGIFYLCDERDYKELLVDYHKPQAVISSLPYHQTQSLAEFCIDSGIRYCDLGGRVDVSHNINQYAIQHAEKPVMTDLGLAPGWVNILAEQGCREIYDNVTDVEMMVGGLPSYLRSNLNPLRYGVTWSVDGLINEYRDDCLVLEDGKIKTVKGMDGLEQIETESLGKLEAFYTSGGASHSIHSMKTRGVKNCSYKTLRYIGHGAMVKFLIRDCALDDETLEKIFLNGCGIAEEDEVIIYAKVKAGDKTWKKERLIQSDCDFSAMQKATAFPISSVAAIMAEGKMEGDKEQHRDHWIQYNKSLSYADIPSDLFNDNLNELFESRQ